MTPHQQRVVDEQVALGDKIVKMIQFFGSAIYPDLDPSEQERLQRQYRLMLQYSNVLAERIAAFPSST